MKKRVWVLMMLIFAILLTACAPAASTATTTASTTKAAAATTQAPAATTAASATFKKMNLIAGNAAQNGDSLDTAMDFFIEEFGKRTNGAVTGSVAPSSQLGGHTDMISAIQMGSMQVSEATASILSTVAPKFAIFDIPYMAPGSANDVYKLLSGKAGEILNQNLIEKAGLRVISWMCRTPRHVYSASRPITKLEDWKGMKIRTMQSKAMTEAMVALGAQPTAIATAERYMALQTGVVEAAENNVAEVFNCKEYEVTKYLSKTGHLCSPNVMYVSEKWFQSLPADYQKLVLTIGEEAGRLATKIESDSEANFESKLVSVGKMTVNVLTPDTLAKFRETLNPVYKKYESVLGADLIALFQTGK